MSTIDDVNPKAWRSRLPSTLDELAELRARANAAVVAGSTSQVIAGGFVHWAWGEMLGEPQIEGRSSATLALYRRMLAELAATPLSSPPGRKRQRRIQPAADLGDARRRRRSEAGLATVGGAVMASSIAGASAALCAGRAVLVPVAMVPALLGALRGLSVDVRRSPRIPVPGGYVKLVPVVGAAQLVEAA